MKRLLLLVLIGWFGGTELYAQDYERLYKFLDQYGSNWNHGYRKEAADGRSELVNQLGTPAPRYTFSKELNSKTMKGKFVIMNFWSTWCGGCRALCMALDSLMVKHSNDYRDVQIIGVNYKETLADKGYKAKEWWKQKAFGYPTTDDNKGVDEFSTTVQAGHPTMMLIDDKGIIRGRWDAWSPGTADNAALAVWVLKIVPEQGLTLDFGMARRCMEEKQYLRALYVLCGLDETAEILLMKLEALLHISSYQGGTLLAQMVEEAKESKDYDTLLEIAEIVERNEELYSAYCKIGLDAATVYNNYSRKGNDETLLLGCKLKYRYGKQMQEEVLRTCDQNIRIHEMNGKEEDKVEFWKKAKANLQ